MKRLFENSILEKLFNSRSEELSHKIIKNSKEYQKLIKCLFDHVLSLAEFWNNRYYKIGFSDGLRVKKEVEQSLEGLTDG